MAKADKAGLLQRLSSADTAVIASILLLVMAPVAWTGNEINYFDLAWRFVSPGQFGPNHAVFDQSNARFASFLLLGGLIKIFGYEGAFIVARLLSIVGYAVAITFMTRAWRLSLVETAGVVILFLLFKQNYFAGEWLFDGVEAKVFAYIAIIAGIGFAWREKYSAAVIAAALGTYFHFLVGGFWAAAVMALILLRTKDIARVVRLSLVYVLLILPILGILVYEQFVMPAPEGLDPKLLPNEIYSAFRNPHHLAPFLNAEQMRIWLPGGCWMLAVMGLLALGTRQQNPDGRLLSAWLFGLHGYLLLAFIAAFIDRHSYILGPLYLFRPNSLILFLSLACGFLWLRQFSYKNMGQMLAALTLAATFSFAVPRIVAIGYSLLISPRLPLEKTLKPKDRELVDWIRGNTDRNAVVVIGRGPDTDWAFPWVAFERLVGRPTLVSFKFAPTQKAEILRWHRLLLWRDAIFRGDCARLSEQPVDYLVIVEPAAIPRMAGCGDVVWSNGVYSVMRAAARPH